VDAAPARPVHIPITLPANTTPPVTGNIFEFTTPATTNPDGTVQTRVFDMSTVPNVTEVRTMPGSVFNNMSAAQASNVVMLDPGPAPSRHAPSTFNIHGATNPGQLDTAAVTYSYLAPISTIIAPGVETVRIVSVTTAGAAGDPFSNGGLADATRLEVSGTGRISLWAGDREAPAVIRDGLVIDASGLQPPEPDLQGFAFDGRWASTNGITIIGSATHSNEITDTSGNDVIRGGAQTDLIMARAGNDTIDAGAGNDLISSGSGNDRITLGAGRDSVGFGAHGASNADIVTDFVVGEDRIYFFATWADAGWTGTVRGSVENTIAIFGAFGPLAPAAFLSASNNVATSAAHRIIYNTSNGELWFDQDGTGAIAPSLIATFIGIPALTASDINI